MVKFFLVLLVFVCSCAAIEDFKSIQKSCDQVPSSECVYGPYCFGFSAPKVNMILDNCTLHIQGIDDGRRKKARECPAIATVRRVAFYTYEITLVGRIALQPGPTGSKFGWIGLSFSRELDLVVSN